MKNLKQKKKKLYSGLENELSDSTKKILYNLNNKKVDEKKREINESEKIIKNIKIEKKDIKPILTPQKNNNNNMNKINESQANVIFSKYSGLNHSMNFNSFINSFPDLIENILKFNLRQTNFIDFGQLFKKVLVQKIIPNLINTDLNENCLNNQYDNNNGLIQYAYLKLKEEKNMNDLLKKFSNVIETYFKFYCEKNNYTLIFENCKKFFEDFWIFPDFINQLQLKNLFYFLSNKSEYLHFNKFVESFGIIALINDFEDNFDPIDKLIYIIDKMNQSNGDKKCILKSGRIDLKGKKLIDFCIYLKKEYPNFYDRKNNKKTYPDASLSFSDIYGKSFTK